VQNEELAHLVVGVVWSQDLNRFYSTVHVDLTLLQHLGHLLLSVLLEPLYFLFEVGLSLSILNAVDRGLVQEALSPGDKHSIIEDLQVSHHQVNVIACDQGDFFCLLSSLLPSSHLTDKEVRLVDLQLVLEPGKVLYLLHPVVDTRVHLFFDFRQRFLVEHGPLLLVLQADVQSGVPLPLLGSRPVSDYLPHGLLLLLLDQPRELLLAEKAIDDFEVLQGYERLRLSFVGEQLHEEVLEDDGHELLAPHLVD